MTEPGVPSDDERVLLPCGESVHPHQIDLGMREFACSCGESHAVVTDVHPLSRFVPEELVAILEEVVETEDEFPTFTTAHALAMVREEFPEAVVSADCADDGHVGYALLWVCDFDARRLHELVVELLVELMDHAVGHSDDETAVSEFDRQLAAFDVTAFVEAYRSEREFDSEFDTPV